MFDRKKSDALFTDTLDLLDMLNTRDGRFEYADYVALHNNITALYDSFMDCKDGCGEDNQNCGYCEKPYAAYSRLAAYEDSGLSPEEVQELAKAKADGRLVGLPCKAGDVVYVVSGCLFYRDRSPYTPCEVVVFKQGKQRGTMMHLRPLCEEAVGTRYHRWFPVTSIGLTVFLTREAAEKALGGRKIMRRGEQNKI